MHSSILTYHWADEQMWLDLFPGLSPRSATKAIQTAQQTILTNRSIALACFFASEVGFEAFKMQQLVIQSNDPIYASLFAAIVPNADIKTLQSLVIKSNNLTAMVRFAVYVKCDTQAIQKAIIKSNNAKAAYELLKWVPSASATKLKDPILKSRKPIYLLELARRIRSKKVIKQIEDILVKDKAIKHCRIFAQTIEGASFKRLEKVVMGSGIVKEIKQLSKTKDSQAAALGVLF